MSLPYASSSTATSAPTTPNTDRLQRLRQLLTERGLDAVLITHPSNRFYLSGYTGEDLPPDESAGILLVSPDVAVVMTSPNNVGWARSEAAGFEAIPWQRPWIKSVAEQIKQRGWRRLGFEENATLVATHRDLLSELDGAELVALGDAVDQLRRVKEPAELAALAAAIALTDEVFVAATAGLQPGITERELAWRIEREMRERGAEGPAFETIVASGPHSARPHHRATDRPIGPGEPVIIDMGARLRGYNGDLTRTIWLGEPDARLREIYPIVAAAQHAALAAMRPGVSGKDADAAAREVIAAAGFDDAFLHGLGHGLGVRVHEAPSAGPTSQDVLQAGEVVTLEPGIYLPGWGGVRIEDVGVIEASGVRVLTRAPKRREDRG